MNWRCRLLGHRWSEREYWMDTAGIQAWMATLRWWRRRCLRCGCTDLRTEALEERR